MNLRPPPWTRQAACAGHPLGPAAWDGEGTPQALLVCATCPVQLDCAREALTHAIDTGMWGGLTPTDRRRAAHTHGYDTPGTPRHGERARYVAGCRCTACREAHRRWVAERRATGAWTRPAAADRRIPA